MTNEKTGGSAFPMFYRIPGQDRMEGPTGMTLWDWYAGQALSGLVSADNCFVHSPKDIAEWATNHADAMIAERKKRGIA